MNYVINVTQAQKDDFHSSPSTCTARVYQKYSLTVNHWEVYWWHVAYWPGSFNPVAERVLVVRFWGDWSQQKVAVLTWQTQYRLGSLAWTLHEPAAQYAGTTLASYHHL